MRKPLMLRRIVGTSMNPSYKPNKLVLATSWYFKLRPGDAVIIRHNGIEKIKRIDQINDDKIYVLGDHGPASTDSRHFGWLPKDNVIAKILR